jgi:hypothetical protein
MYVGQLEESLTIYLPRLAHFNMDMTLPLPRHSMSQVQTMESVTE